VIQHSIIIPTFNRSAVLAETLASISALDGKEHIEVIVVDNGSTDNTKETVEGFKTNIPHLQYAYDAMPGLLTGRHKGAELAKAELLSFIDDDVLLNRQWSMEIVNCFNKDEETKLITGPCLPHYESTPPAWLESFWEPTGTGGLYCGWLSLLDEGKIAKPIDPLFVWGLNFSIRKTVFMDLGGFHPDNIPAHLQQFQGDGETGLSIKAKEKKYRSMYLPGASLRHQVPMSRLTIGYFDKRAFYQGICDSYTQLRTLHGLYEQEGKNSEEQNGNKPSLIRRAINRMRRIKFVSTKAPILNNEAEDMKLRLKAAYDDGFRFHQNVFNSDTEVRDWVLKKNYFNYQLPNHV
jgi:glycosyltransferase involved in cell wall biosynthesis